MRSIHVNTVTEAVADLCVKANYELNTDIRQALEKALAQEKSETGKSILESLIENARIAREESLAICQDTGMAVIFVEVGQNLSIEGGSLEEAIQEGVRLGYKKGYLRNSVVADPLLRKNTGDNTPAVIHWSLTPRDRLVIEVAPKGFGSENMSALKMLKPSDGEEGVKAFVVDTVSRAGANPCPPIVVGVGLGGTMEKAALLAKKALMRPLDKPNETPHLARIEEELLERINRLGVGPAGLGGRTTALGVNVESFPTHIAGLPVAVNISCHVTRHRSVSL